MTPDELAQLLDVEHRWAFRAKTVVVDGNQVRQTECNDYLGVFAAARGVRIPGGLTANQLVDWLEAQAKAGADGWQELLTATEARASANLFDRFFTCAVMKEPGHGHVAPMLPCSPDKPDVSRVSAAGGACLNAGPLVNSFGLQAPGVIRYFARPLPKP